jgi:iron-sulfur cluster assembly protein
MGFALRKRHPTRNAQLATRNRKATAGDDYSGYTQPNAMTTLTLTDEAVTRLRNVLDSQQAPDGALRVFVSPGGCSGFSYGMSLEPEPADDDEVVEQSGVKVVVDPFSLQYLSGAQIDFIDSLMGGGFTVVNPNAVKSCACGQSFDTTFGGGAAKPCH